MQESDEHYRLRKTIELTKKLAQAILFINECNKLSAGMTRNQLVLLENFLEESLIMKASMIEELLGKGVTLTEIGEQVGVSKNSISRLLSQGQRIEERRNKAREGVPETADPLDRKLDEFQIPVRARNCFVYENISTLRDLTSRTEADLRRIPNMGKLTITQIVHFLDTLNLKLATHRSAR